MGEGNLAPLHGGLQDGEADLQRGLAPASVADYRSVVRQSGQELVDDFALAVVDRDPNLALFPALVDEYPIRRGAQVAAVAAHQSNPEVGVVLGSVLTAPLAL